MDLPTPDKAYKIFKGMKDKKVPLWFRILYFLVLVIIVAVIVWGVKSSWKWDWNWKKDNSFNLYGDNSGAISYGDNSTAIVNNVNKESTYAWINKDSWIIDTEFCNERCKYDVRLFFEANGPVVPLMSCIIIKTDACITSFSYNLFSADDIASDYLSNNNLKSGVVCFSSDIGRTPEVRLGFLNEPTSIMVELIDKKDLPENIVEEKCK